MLVTIGANLNLKLASAQTSPDPAPSAGALSWVLRDFKDKMTDKVTRKAASESSFDGGVLIQVAASCAPYGVEFAFYAFRNREPAPFVQKEKLVGMRTRIDSGEVRMATGSAAYTNVAETGFYDAPFVEKQVKSNTHPLGRVLDEMALMSVQKNALGRLDQLLGARSIRVELPLADGGAYVVDLNPQDQTLKSIVLRCQSELQAQALAEQQAAQQAHERAERERLAKQEEQRRQNEQSFRRMVCPAGQEKVVFQRGGWLVPLDQFDPRKPAGPGAGLEIPVGTKVRIVDDTGYAANLGIKIPRDRCTVSVRGAGLP